MKDLLTSALDAHGSLSRWREIEAFRLKVSFTENDFNNTKGKLNMKTKLQLSKNVTLNKPDGKRQGMKVRTVVTGHNAKGRAVFVRDEKVDGTPIPGLGELAFLWNADEPATYPNAGNNPAAPGIFPPLGGIRFIIGSYLPGDFIAPEPTPEMHLEDGDELGGANAGFHRTDTTDFGVVLSGNLALQLDDGAEVSLSPGEVVIAVEASPGHRSERRRRAGSQQDESRGAGTRRRLNLPETVTDMLIERSDDNGSTSEQEYPYHRRQQRDRAGRGAGIRQRGSARRHLRLESGVAAGGEEDAWSRKSRRSRGRQQSHRPRHDVRHDQAGVRAPGRRLRKCGLQRVPVVRRGDRAKFR